MIGAGLLARDLVDGRRHGRDRSAPAVSGRLVVCPTPIGNLEDVTLRVLAALREADVVACEDTRHTRVLLERYGVRRSSSATTSTTSARGRPSWSSGCARAPSSRWSATPGMPLVSDPGFPLVQGCVAAGLAVEVLPGPSSALDRAGGERAAVRRLALRRLPAAQARRAGGRLRRAGDARRLRVAARGSAPRWPCSPSSTRTRPVAVCRELTKLHEEIVRGSAAELAARYAGRGRRAARSCVVVGGAPAPTGLDPAAVEAVRTLVESGARAKTAAKVVAELTGAPANALYREVARPDRSRSSPPPCGSPRGSGRARCRGRSRASARAATRPGRR